jgi:hypothetical protein
VIELAIALEKRLSCRFDEVVEVVAVTVVVRMEVVMV